ncbi:MAG TPA: sugar phosphate nucleotidyltransferase [Bacteroidales bacterium]|nr:sugar phosphate nucleotidyltransferase [Bacteroidales bacterium]
MKGVIFAAGLGTRLYPFTKDKPKALVEVQGKAMLGHTLDKFRAAGILDVVINVHAFADLVELYIKEYAQQFPDMLLTVSDERELLLETGGGLLKMQPFLDEPFVVHNVDVLSTIDLSSLGGSSLATLAVRRCISDRYFLFNQEGLLCGWENVRTGEQKISRPKEGNFERFGFTGIHRISPSIFPLMTERGIFSITDVYLRLAVTHDIRMVDVTDAAWFDIGSPEQLKEAERNSWRKSIP